MGAIDQTLFDSNIANTITAAEDLKNALGAFPAPGESGSSQETANAAATARDAVYKVSYLAEHKTPGTIDQPTFDAKMKVLLVAKDSLQKAEDDLQDSYTDYTSAANLLIMDIEALASFMTDAPATRSKAKKEPAKEHKEPGLVEMAKAKLAGSHKFKGFGRR